MKSELSVVGIDLAKSIFHLVGTDARGKIILRKRLARGEVLPFMAQLPRVLVGMEACGGAHYWARHLREQGHEVKLMAPQYVKPVAHLRQGQGRRQLLTPVGLPDQEPDRDQGQRHVMMPALPGPHLVC